MSNIKPADWSMGPLNIIPLPDWKVRIRCTKEQWDHFRVHACPGKFDPSWKDIYLQNCEFNEETNCQACWDEYAIWEDING